MTDKALKNNEPPVIPGNRIEILVDGWWVKADKYGDLRVGDLFRGTKVKSLVARVTRIISDGDGGIFIKSAPVGRQSRRKSDEQGSSTKGATICACCGNECEPGPSEWSTCSACIAADCQGAPWRGEGSVERGEGCPLLEEVAQKSPDSTKDKPPTHEALRFVEGSGVRATGFECCLHQAFCSVNIGIPTLAMFLDDHRDCR